MADKSREIPGRWSQRKRDIGTSLWVALLAACVGTFVIFAVLDPEALNEAWVLPWEMSSRLAYSLGFVFLFAVCFMASYLSVFMFRTGPRSGHALGKGRRRPPEVHPPTSNNPDLDVEDWR